jgi:hypothetical protein
MKGENGDRVTAREEGAPATLGSLPTLAKRKIFTVCILLCVMMWKERLMAVHLDRLAPYERTAWDEREQFESNLHEK